MIKTITVTNHLGESIRLELANPYSSGFIIKEITGLGPVKATINFTELATSDGAVDNSALLDSRNIVFSLEFLKHPSIEATRLNSYKYFPIKRNVTITIETDSRICETVGRVESNEPKIFSQQEGCQISILCPDPYFYSAGDMALNRTLFYGTEPLFHFPFCNDDLHEPQIVFGNIVNRTEGTVFYDGDAEIGIIIRIHAIGEAKGLAIYNINTREVMRIDDAKLIALTGSGIVAGDDIVINTMLGKKGITLLRRGVTTNILNVLGKPIQWFKLSKGDNLFAYTTEEGISNLQFTIENQILYEGV